MTYVCGKPLAVCLAHHGAAWMFFPLVSLPALLIVLELVCVEGPSPPWLPQAVTSWRAVGLVQFLQKLNSYVNSLEKGLVHSEYFIVLLLFFYYNH